MWVLLALPGLVLLALAAGAFFVLVQSVPVPADLDAPATVVFDDDGEEIGTLQQHQGREEVELATLPDHVTRAVLAAEDANFYEHSGVSLPGVARALLSNVRAGEVAQGGSTISQQYVKNFTGESERTYLRKVREAATAMKLEQQYTKDEILQLYLNSIYFGRGAYGIQAAAQAYYGVDAAELTVAQAAQLAGVIPAPSAYDPADNPADAAQRYDYVLRRMEEEGWLDAARAESLAGDPPETVAPRSAAQGPAPFYLDMVEAELAELVGDQQIYQGLEVHTHLDLDMQEAAREHYEAAFAELAEGLRASDPEVTIPTGAIVSLEPSTGGIKALIGGSDYAEDQLNLVTGGPDEAGRQPGSTFKPFALAAWIAAGRSPQSTFPAPAEITFSAAESGDPDGWSPGNYGGTGFGRMTLAQATWRSVNTVYAQVGVDLGAEAIVETAQAAGIDRELEPVPSIVLGTQEVTPLELATAYNTLAAGGVTRLPTTIVSVSRDGQEQYRSEPVEEASISEQVAWTTVDVLRGVITQGSGTAAQIGRPAFGKTGTTQDSADAWFAGATPNLTTVVWMGNRDNRESMPGSPTGGGLPARLWADYMVDALQDIEPSDFPAPDGDLEIVGAARERAAEPAAEAEPTAAPEPEPTAAPEPEPEPTTEPEPEPTTTPEPVRTAPPPENDGDDGDGDGDGEGGGGGDGQERIDGDEGGNDRARTGPGEDPDAGAAAAAEVDGSGSGNGSGSGDGDGERESG